jgi:hypothetical protein
VAFRHRPPERVNKTGDYLIIDRSQHVAKSFRELVARRTGSGIAVRSAFIGAANAAAVTNTRMIIARAARCFSPAGAGARLPLVLAVVW